MSVKTILRKNKKGAEMLQRLWQSWSLNVLLTSTEHSVTTVPGLRPER